MEIGIEKRGNVSTLRISGEINAITCTDLETALGGLMEEGETRIVIDLKGTRYVSSAGLRVILGAAQRLHRCGRFAICGANENVYDILQIAGFPSIIDMFEDAVKAQAAVSPL